MKPNRFWKQEKGNAFLRGIACAAVLAGTLAACGRPAAQGGAGASSRSAAAASFVSAAPEREDVSSDGSSCVLSSSGDEAPGESGAQSAPASSSGPAGTVSAPSSEARVDAGWTLTAEDRGSVAVLKKADGTRKEIFLGKAAFAPCLAGGWVYYFQDLDEIWKVKADGSRKAKVCGTDAIGNLSGSTLVTAECRGGTIRYRVEPMRQAGDSAPAAAPAYYELDLSQGRLTPVS